MRFGSVCSGIEAASVAWNPLGWKAAWLSEIEPFPSAVLAHHYPDVPNLGDMTTLPERIRSGDVEAPDVFCGGTPCQAFSVAGLRKSLADDRGNLSLTFCEIADAIDESRSVRGLRPAIVFWENVPGVLSTADNAFGCFLAQLCGGDEPLVAPDGWPDAGCVSGPSRTAAWRILDAQYFGVAQRRRRVFVVASARNDFDPAAVLFEFGGVRRDTPPSREAGQNTTGSARASASFGGISPVAGTLTANTGGMTRPAGNANELDFCIPTYAIQGSMIGRNDDAGPAGDGVNEEICFTQNTIDRHAIATTLAFAQNQRDEVRVMEVVGALAAEPGAKQQTYLAQPVAFQQTADCLTAAYGTKWNGNASATNGSLFAAQPMAPVAIGWDEELNASTEQSGTLLRGGQGGRHDGVMTPTMQVRRLTPTECERLQGFPDGYTAIPWRNKPAEECPDGPRYKALGNSWAVPVVRWIGRRIQEAA